MTVSAHVLAAALTAVSANGSRISETSMTAALEAAIAVLNATPADTLEHDLQAGEQYLLHNHEENETDIFDTREDLDRELQRLVDHYGLNDTYRTLCDYVNLYIIRACIPVDSKKTVTVVFG